MAAILSGGGGGGGGGGGEGGEGGGRGGGWIKSSAINIFYGNGADRGSSGVLNGLQKF